MPQATALLDRYTHNHRDHALPLIPCEDKKQICQESADAFLANFLTLRALNKQWPQFKS